jgi:flagellar hook-length control protein FliK
MSSLKVMDFAKAPTRGAHSRAGSRLHGAVEATSADNLSDKSGPTFVAALAAQRNRSSKRPQAAEVHSSKVDKSQRKSREKTPEKNNDLDKSHTQTAESPSADQADDTKVAEAQSTTEEIAGEVETPEQNPVDSDTIAVNATTLVVAPPTADLDGAMSTPDAAEAGEPKQSPSQAAPTPKVVVMKAPVKETPPDPTQEAEQVSDAANDQPTKQEAPAFPPTAGVQAGKQAHEKSNHAAHVQAVQMDASAKDAAAAQAASPRPSSIAETAGALVEAATTDEAAAEVPTKDQAAKPTAPPGLQLVMAEGRGLAKETDGAETAPNVQESPNSQAADTMDQIVLGLKGKLDARTGKAEIRLDPPNLGAMKVSVTLENGQLTAEFQSPSSVVRDLLRGNIEKLKTVLEGQGVTVDRLAVSAPPDTGNPNQNPQASFGSATHDGRSAGQHTQDPRSNQGRSGDGFARLFTQAQEAPLDLVA